MRVTRSFVRRVVEEMELTPRRLTSDEDALKKTLVLALGRIGRSVNPRQIQVELPRPAEIALAGIIRASLPKWEEERVKPWKDPADRSRSYGQLRQAKRVLADLERAGAAPVTAEASG